MAAKGKTEKELWTALVALDDDLLDPDLPEAALDRELRALGIDPAALAKRGGEFVAKVKEEERLSRQVQARERLAPLEVGASRAHGSANIGRADSTTGGATADAIVVNFQARSVIPSVRAAAADTRPVWGDPSGPTVLSMGAVTVQVREHMVGVASEVAIRIVAKKGHGIDLNRADAVVVRDAHDAIRPLLHLNYGRLYWSASFAGEGVFDVEIVSATLRGRIVVERPRSP